MAKNDRSGGGKFEKSGYRPLNEGYSPKDQRGYSPLAQTGKLPKAPPGGTGESSKPSRTVPTGGQKK
jgi:hypothetical protein